MPEPKENSSISTTSSLSTNTPKTQKRNLPWSIEGKVKSILGKHKFELKYPRMSLHSLSSSFSSSSSRRKSKSDESSSNTNSPNPALSSSFTSSISSTSIPGKNEANITQKQMKHLSKLGFPEGLSIAFAKNSNGVFQNRFWVLDNSLSTSMLDGYQIVECNNNVEVGTKIERCSRWEETKECVQYHAKICSLFASPTEFRLLNKQKGVERPNIFSVGERGADLARRDYDRAMRIIHNTDPSGLTPLTEHILAIRKSIQNSLVNTLEEEGKKASIILVTDGLPNEEDVEKKTSEENFEDAIRSFDGLPVKIVVRLVTEEVRVVNYYNKLKNDLLDVDLEVIDNYQSEAKKVHTHNPWINYTVPIHRVREQGFHHHILELINERPLDKNEIKEFCALLLGESRMVGLSDPNDDWSSFSKQIRNLLNEEGERWNIIKKKKTPLVDFKEIDHLYGKFLRRASLKSIRRSSSDFLSSRSLLRTSASSRQIFAKMM